jgi:hypothetical protein
MSFNCMKRTGVFSRYMVRQIAWFSGRTIARCNSMAYGATKLPTVFLNRTTRVDDVFEFHLSPLSLAEAHALQLACTLSGEQHVRLARD